MKRQWKLVLCLMMAALLLTSCSGGGSSNQTVFPEITQNLGLPQVTDVPTPEPTAEPTPEPDANEEGSVFTDNPFDGEPEYSETDPLAEENYQEPVDLSDSISGNYTVVQETEYTYAGSTPIPLDPVDMPTPTPRPDLAFTYSTYIASTVGVTFQGPVSWMVDESMPSMMVLSEPTNQIKEGQQCVVTLSAEPVSSNYDQGDLKSHVNQRLDTLYISDYTDWKPSYTATRYMMGSEGVYANYTATRSDGVEIGGRIHYTCIDNVLYGLEIVFPVGYKDDFIDVFGEIRSSMEKI